MLLGIVIGGIFVRCRAFPARLEEHIGDFAALSVAVDGLARREGRK